MNNENLVILEEFKTLIAQPGIYIWLTDYLKFDFFTWEIKRHTKNAYNHAMIQTAPGFLFSQNWTFKQIPPENYLDGRNRVKLIRVPCTAEQELKAQAQTALLDQMRPRYDWFGIFGFLFRKQAKVQFKSRFYCSEAVLTILQQAGVYQGNVSLSPGDIDRMIDTQCWDVVGIYDPTIADH